MDFLHELMSGAGLGDMMKSQSMLEHERLVDLLGGSNKSNFIARMMAEDKYKHALPVDQRPAPYRPGRKNGRKTANPTKGIYRKPVMDAEVDDTDMRQPITFDFNKLAAKRQDPSGVGPKKYGASPFIIHHFGNVASDAKKREDAKQKAARKFFGTQNTPDDDDDDDDEPPPPRARKARKVRNQAAAKEARAEAMEDFRQRRANVSMADRESNGRKPESVKRAERKKRQLAALSPAEKAAKKDAEKAAKIYVPSLRRSVRRNSQEGQDEIARLRDKERREEIAFQASRRKG